ncbi:unnamed protein product [Orchesella dallaii]|uniref:Uncharacterized protein n=1 Tax=Orchesella dallaii TaxID=48710 RepID=A0ABP1S8P7_9HEXA
MRMPCLELKGLWGILNPLVDCCIFPWRVLIQCMKSVKNFFCQDEDWSSDETVEGEPDEDINMPDLDVPEVLIPVQNQGDCSSSGSTEYETYFFTEKVLVSAPTKYRETKV